MSRNDERILPNSETTSEETPQKDSFFEFLEMPVLTEVIDLPSEGKLYSTNSALYGREYIEIKYPTTKEQEILNSRSLQKKNLNVDRMLECLFVDKSVKPGELLNGDKNAILIKVRELMFGPGYDIRLICPVCANVDETFSFNLEKSTLKPVLSQEELAAFGVSEVRDAAGNLFFEFQLPKTKFYVQIRLAVGDDELQMLGLSERKKKNNIEETPIEDQLMALIHSVAGKTSPEIKKQFLAKAPVIDTEHIMQVYKKIEPNRELKTKYSCPVCLNISEDIEVPLSVRFFRPKRRL